MQKANRWGWSAWILHLLLSICTYTFVQMHNSISEIMFGYWFSIFFSLLRLCVSAKSDFLLCMPRHIRRIAFHENQVLMLRCRCISFSITNEMAATILLSNTIFYHLFMQIVWGIQMFNGRNWKEGREWERSMSCFLLIAWNCECDQFEMAVLMHTCRESEGRHHKI